MSTSAPGIEPSDSRRSVAPSRMTTIAVSPAMRPMPSAAPVEMFGRTAGSRTRRIVAILRLAQAVGGLAHVARDRLQALARGAEDHRQRDQRHHRAGRQERAAEDRAALGGERQPAEEAMLEERQAEDREHDVGRAGDDLDAGLDHPRQPRRPAVLDDPDRGRDRDRRGDRDADDRQQDRAEDRVQEAAGRADWSTSPLGCDQQQARLEVLDARAPPCSRRSARRSGRAPMPAAQHMT